MQCVVNDAHCPALQIMFVKWIERKQESGPEGDEDQMNTGVLFFQSDLFEKG